MMLSGVCRRGIESVLVGLAGADGLGEGVVDFEDDTFGAVVAPLLIVFALHDGAGVQDAGHGVPGRGEGLGDN